MSITKLKEEKLSEALVQWLGKLQLHSDAYYQTHLKATWDRGHQMKFQVEYGSKYIKVITIAPGHRSVFAFVDSDGNIYKAATWKAPAKHVRGSVYNAEQPMTLGELYIR